MAYSKGSKPQNASYAKGGGVTSRAKDFMKDAPEAFRSAGVPNPNYATGKKPKGEDKSEKAIVPRS
jgi:hypothetical protein